MLGKLAIISVPPNKGQNGGPLGPYHIQLLLSLASPDHCLCGDQASHVAYLEMNKGSDGCSEHHL